MPRPLAVAMLLTTMTIWGFAFVSQKTAMETMGPYTFASMRYLLGGLCVLPLALGEWTRRNARSAPLTPRQWGLITVLIVVFFFGSLLQQVGLQTTTVTNAGFLTGLYVFFTPFFGYLIYRTSPHPIVYACVPLVLIGLYYLNGGRLDAFNSGDFLVIGCAACWGLQILMIGVVAKETGLPIFISVASFIVTGLVSIPLALWLETPTLDGITAGWFQIAYAGLLSTGLAFTFQAIAQQHLPASNAAIIQSGESLVAAIGGAIFVHERLTPVGYAGAAVMFIAIVLVELVPVLTRKPAAAH